MATKFTIEGIRKGIEQHLGKGIIVRANKGRKRIVIREGILENTYPDVFVIKIMGNHDNNTRVSYRYADVLTSNVQLTLLRGSLQ